MGQHLRTARLNRFRQKFGLQPLPRVGQVWHVKYSGWGGSRTDIYYLLIRPGGVDVYNGKKIERWHVIDLETGRTIHSNPTYSMLFDYEASDKTQMHYYELVTEAP